MKKIANLLTNNWGLKLLSLVLALFLWFVVVQVEDPTDQVSFNNVRVQLVNSDLLDKQNKVFEVLDNTDVVKVTVRAPRSITKNLRAADITAQADMSKLTDINTVAITYDCNADGITSIDGNHDSVRLNVENAASKYIALVANLVGEPSGDYMVGNLTLDQNMIEISGPQSEVDAVSYACLDVDVTGSTSNISANVEIRVCDANGETARVKQLKKQTDYAHISVEILSTKMVPVVVGREGVPASGFIVSGDTIVSPATIKVAGSANAISGISKISVTDPVIITGASETVVQDIVLNSYLPSNIRLADMTENVVSVSVPIEPIATRKMEIGWDNVKLIDVPDGMKIELSTKEEEETWTVDVYGLASEIEMLISEDLGAYISISDYLQDKDLTRLAVGNHVMPVKFSTIESVGVSTELELQVIVSEEEE